MYDYILILLITEADKKLKKHFEKVKKHKGIVSTWTKSLVKGFHSKFADFS